MASKTPLGVGSENRPQISIFRGSTASESPPGVRLDRLLCEMEPEIRCLAHPNIVVQIGCLIPEPGPIVALLPAEAQDLLRHLVIDACDAMPAGGTLCLIVGIINIDSARSQTHPELLPGSYVTLLVRDTGASGSETEASSHSASLLKKGRALGLSAAYEAIQGCDGCLTVSRRQHETAICIYFPCMESGASGNMAGSPAGGPL